MPKIRFVSQVPNLMICYSDIAQHPVSGVNIVVTKTIKFNQGAYSTDNEKEFRAIRGAKSFNRLCFEVLDKATESLRNTGQPEMSTGVKTTANETRLQGAKETVKKPEYIKSGEEENKRDENRK